MKITRQKSERSILSWMGKNLIKNVLVQIRLAISELIEKKLELIFQCYTFKMCNSKTVFVYMFVCSPFHQLKGAF
jgi:hypothetical protein